MVRVHDRGKDVHVAVAVEIDGEDAMERLRTGLVAEIGAQTDPTRLAEASA